MPAVSWKRPVCRKVGLDRGIGDSWLVRSLSSTLLLAGNLILTSDHGIGREEDGVRGDIGCFYGHLQRVVEKPEVSPLCTSLAEGTDKGLQGEKFGC